MVNRAELVVRALDAHAERTGRPLLLVPLREEYDRHVLATARRPAALLVSPSDWPEGADNVCMWDVPVEIDATLGPGEVAVRR